MPMLGRLLGSFLQKLFYLPGITLLVISILNIYNNGDVIYQYHYLIGIKIWSLNHTIRPLNSLTRY